MKFKLENHGSLYCTLVTYIIVHQLHFNLKDIFKKEIKTHTLRNNFSQWHTLLLPQREALSEGLWLRNGSAALGLPLCSCSITGKADSLRTASDKH